MQAILIKAPHATPILGEVPVPDIPPHGALIEVRATGVCRSDWHAWVGHDPTVRFPHVPGHEYAGVVHELGREVRTFQGGERVTSPFCCGCGTCPRCRAGHQNLCEREFQPGFDGWGTFARYVMIPWADVNLVHLPEAFDFPEAASLGCRFTTAFRGLVDRAGLGPGESLVVYGCGGVGLACVLIGVALGARVIGVDIREEKLALARELGATEVVHAGRDEPVDAVVELTGGGADVSVDAIGRTRVVDQAVRSLRPRGRHLQLGLLLEDETLPAGAMQRVVRQELTVLGGHGMQAWCYRRMLDFIHHRSVPIGRLIGERRPLSEAGRVLSSMGEFTPVGVTILDLDMDGMEDPLQKEEGGNA